ncbi:MAG: ATP-binding cassette domain-containing protein [Ruminococcus sp.]|nr:ATP-binding cassette domain-containing protein [Ruminococcus sp.]
MSYILETQNLTKTYGKKDAIKDINIHISKGEIYGLIGRNGAGKTTIMRIITGLSSPTSGSYSLFGKTGAEARKFMNKVGVLIESPGLYPERSAYENLKIKCIGMGINPNGYVEKLLETVGLENVDNKKGAGSFSLGMRQRLGIALALVGEPEIIVLDEPINGLDPQGIVEVRHTLEKLRNEKGITVMISSHILDELGKLATKYGIIHEGKLLDEFTTDELKSRCGKYVIINSDNNDGVIKTLRSIGVEDAVVDNDNNVRVGEHLDESDRMAKAIVNADISLKEIYINNVSLEDYYLSVTGGQHNG